MEIKLLGPIEARVNGRSVAPTAAKPRQVLALLALQAGQVVPVPMLMEELWGVAPPRSALTTLQTYVLQLRRLIRSAPKSDGWSGDPKEVLATRYNGYLLDVAPQDVDVKEYERLSALGRRAVDAGELEEASRLTRQALALWRGQALVDVQIGMRLGFEVAWLEESRLGALESRIDVDLRLGRHTQLLSELAVLTARSPMNENLCCQFMIALYRSGRRWQALEAFRSIRRALVGELGIEPSARLQALQQAILNADQRLYDPAGHEFQSGALAG